MTSYFFMIFGLRLAIPWLPYLAIFTEVANEVANAPESTLTILTPLINVGAIGCVLFWFLLRAEPRFKNIEDAIDRQSRAILLVIIAVNGVPPFVKEQAKNIVSEIENKP